MSRRIYFDPPVTEASSFAATAGEKTKDALGKIAQLIPGEILGGMELPSQRFRCLVSDSNLGSHWAALSWGSWALAGM
jgi:hypothetical protein